MASDTIFHLLSMEVSMKFWVKFCTGLFWYLTVPEVVTRMVVWPCVTAPRENSQEQGTSKTCIFTSHEIFRPTKKENLPLRIDRGSRRMFRRTCIHLIILNSVFL